MARLDNTQCPFFKQDCLQAKCSLYDSRLDNCAFHLVTYNLYKLDRTLSRLQPKDEPGRPGKFPFTTN